MKKIGFVVAMSREMKVFLDKLGKVSSNDSSGFRTYSYDIADVKLYMIDAGVGEIASALATFHLIDRYEVDEIINFGVCGSLDNDLDIADIVFVQSVYHFDRDTSALDNCEIGYYTEWGDKYLKTDEKLLQKAQSIYPAKTVICASSEKFVADSALKKTLRAQGASICEMESAGVVLTAKRMNIPCLIVKAISDKADESAHISFDKMLATAMQKCADFILKYLQNA